MTKKQRFVRWQGRSIEELGKFMNLLLGISITTLGFQINLLLTDEYDYHGHKLVFIIALILVFTSILIGLITTFNRLLDFRWTTLLIKKRIKKEPREEIEKFKSRIDNLGNTTWILFSWFISLFTLGLFMLVLYVWNRYIFH